MQILYSLCLHWVALVQGNKAGQLWGKYRQADLCGGLWVVLWVAGIGIVYRECLGIWGKKGVAILGQN